MKPKAIIFDIDGTVAHNDHRSYHDYSESVLKDKPIQPVINALRFYQRQGYKIIFLTGRKDVCYDHTKQWIENHIGACELILFMRSKEYYNVSKNPDYTMKENIFKNKIFPHYDVEAVYEDRKSVKSMWTRNNLFVFDVNQKDLDF